MPTTKKLWRNAAGVPTASGACFENEIACALRQWQSVHSEFDGTQISYECTFRKKVPAGKHSKLIFHADASINGLSGEQDIEVSSCHLKRGLPFPMRAYYDACLEMVACWHTQRCITKCRFAAAEYHATSRAGL